MNTLAALIERLPPAVAVALVVVLCACVATALLLPAAMLLASEWAELRAVRDGPRRERYVLGRVINGLESVNVAFGHVVAWLALLLVLTQFGVVIMRYVFSAGSIRLQESIWYLHGLLFMLGVTRQSYWVLALPVGLRGSAAPGEERPHLEDSGRGRSRA